MKIIHYILITQLFVFCISCSKYDQKISITDIQKPQKITLHKKVNQGGIYAMEIRGSGNLNGKAQIMLMLNGQPYMTEHLNGKISFTWSGDWYFDSMEIRYEPDKVESGNLDIEYDFCDLK